MQWILLLKTVIELIPAILNAVRSVEQAIPESGKGAEKLAFIKEIMDQVLDKADDFLLDFNQVWPSIEVVVNAAVALFNRTGEFKQ